jgi:hypothetical protein
MLRHLWLAEAEEAGRLARLQAFSSRHALTEHLLSLRTEATVIGLDFAFSFPAWFLHAIGTPGAEDLWLRAAHRGEQWLQDCSPPFWGRPGRKRPPPAGPALRRTEAAVPRVRGVAPKSVFQIGGAGAVGTGSIRGMPLLHALSTTGATIWPHTRGSAPLIVVEIYPRLLTREVYKSSASHRESLLEERYPALAPVHRALAVASEDAFDAAVSALVMSEHVEDFERLPDEPDPELRLEGRIWHPGWRFDQP